MGARKFTATYPREYDEETLASFPKPPPLPREREAMARRESMRVAPPPPPPPVSQRPTDVPAANVTPLCTEPERQRDTTWNPTPPPPLDDPRADLAREMSPGAHSQRSTQQQPPSGTPLPLPRSVQRWILLARQWAPLARKWMPLARQWAPRIRRMVPALAVLAVLGGAAFFLFSWFGQRSWFGQSSPAEPEATSATATTLSESTVVESPLSELVQGGQLLIDASPWGQISSLVNDRGELIDLPDGNQTPLVLDLPPGHYTALLTHPKLDGEHKPCVVEVSAEAGAVCRPELLALSADQYWEDMGW